MLFLLVAVINRQLNNFGLSFNGIWAYICGIGLYAIVGWTLSVKYGLLLGIVAAVVAGFIAGQIVGGENE